MGIICNKWTLESSQNMLVEMMKLYMRFQAREPLDFYSASNSAKVF